MLTDIPVTALPSPLLVTDKAWPLEAYAEDSVYAADFSPSTVLASAAETYPTLDQSDFSPRKCVALVLTFSLTNALMAFSLVVAPVPPLAMATVPVTLVAFPEIEAFIVAGSFKVTAALPLTETAVPVFVPSESEMEMFLAVPQLAVVIAALPSKLVPLIDLAVASLVAVAALPVQEAACPVNVDAICVPVVVMLAACPAEDAFSNVHLMDVDERLPSDRTVKRRCIYAVAIFVHISTVDEAAVGQTRTKSARVNPVCDSHIRSDAVEEMTLLPSVRTWTFNMPCLWLE